MLLMPTQAFFLMIHLYKRSANEVTGVAFRGLCFGGDVRGWKDEARAEMDGVGCVCGGDAGADSGGFS
jgi:hypothetical protein